MARPTVVLVDDTPEILTYCARILAQEYEVVGTASDGRRALEICAATNPDVVVMDISMPGWNGLEVARRLRAAGSRMVIVFLSAEECPREAIEAGGTAFVSKNHLARDLSVAIREGLSGRTFISESPND